ncbi:MAG: hypothetical protein RLZZ46_843, partial [Bacteroidota bacterium]
DMEHWLIKSEPFKYSWEQFQKDKKTMWDGVRNYQARNNLRLMKKGDLALFYHSNEGLEIVGIAKVVREHYPDPTSEEGDLWSVVDFAPYKKLPRPVPLSRIKDEEALSGMEMIRLNRLSVTKVTAPEFDFICALGGL